MGHGHPDPDFIWAAENLDADSKIPTSQDFGAANGGEARKSFHGWAPGFAKVIMSPQELYITPMQARIFANQAKTSDISKLCIQTRSIHLTETK